MGISRKTLRKRRHLASASRRRSRELSTAAFEAERERVLREIPIPLCHLFLPSVPNTPRAESRGAPSPIFPPHFSTRETLRIPPNCAMLLAYIEKNAHQAKGGTT